ncbi:MAG: thioredoxin, partial [Bacilli bacterium]|nr:thioredoxin [Bacilli bacterium]
MLKHVNNRDEFNELIKEGTVLVDFFATWCGPCKMLSPVLEELSEESNVLIVKVDVDEAGPLAAQYGIQAVPTLMLFKNG